MSQVSTKILAGRVGRIIVLRLSGRVTAEFCPALRAFCAQEPVDQAEDNAASAAAVVVHLEDVEHFDSTFLGTMLCLRGRFGEDRVALVSPGSECLAGLKRMGAHLLFPIREESLPENVEWVSLSDSVTERDSYDFQHNVVEAHLELARTPGPMQKVYEPIARQAEREFAKRHGWESLTTTCLPKQRVAKSE